MTAHTPDRAPIMPSNATLGAAGEAKDERGELTMLIDRLADDRRAAAFRKKEISVEEAHS